MYKKWDLNGKHSHGGGVGLIRVGMGKGKATALHLIIAAVYCIVREHG